MHYIFIYKKNPQTVKWSNQSAALHWAPRPIHRVRPWNAGHSDRLGRQPNNERSDGEPSAGGRSDCVLRRGVCPPAQSSASASVQHMRRGARGGQRPVQCKFIRKSIAFELRLINCFRETLADRWSWTARMLESFRGVSSPARCFHIRAFTPRYRITAIGSGKCRVFNKRV